jgi:nanoRNase/pAp phosphatase (c-di-AMP/oligoRNAs hydrolase)
MIKKNSRVDGNVLVIDLHRVKEIVSGNRFKEYVLFPKINVSIRVMWGINKENMVFTVGKSILNRSSRTDIGSLMHQYGGGGHPMVGTCQVPVSDWEWALEELVNTLKETKVGSGLWS